MVDEKKRLEVLHDHYNKSCEQVLAHIRTRDKLFLILLMLAAVILFQMAFPGVATDELGLLIKKKAGLSRPVDASFLNSLLWFSVLYVGLRYYQAAARVERLYDYLHGLEEKINVLIGFKDLTREGRAYLKRYPLFSSWAHALYTFVFPVLLGVLLTARIRAEAGDAAVSNAQIAVDVVFFAGCVISIALYMRLVHLRR